MAKLKAPLFSLGASQKLGDALVFFPWKGLNVVREYVVPANPKTAPQVTQRGYLTEIVAAIHAAQALGTDPLVATDVSAYALWGSCYPTPRTWFNQACKQSIDQRVAGLHGVVYRAGASTPGANQLGIVLEFTKVSGANDVTAGTIYYGTSKTALFLTETAAVAADQITATLTGLTSGQKYYWQFRPSAHADYVGAYSGIYYGTPT